LRFVLFALIFVIPYLYTHFFKKRLRRSWFLDYIPDLRSGFSMFLPGTYEAEERDGATCGGGCLCMAGFKEY
jgi:hypothetical protein